MRRWIVPLAAALSLLMATACGDAGEEPATAVAPEGMVRVLTSTEPVLAHRIPGARDVKDLGLTGASIALEVHDTSAVTEVSASAGKIWGLDGPLRAAEGQELFWASLRLLDRPWRTPDAREPELKLVAGEVAMSLAVPDDGGGTVSVPYTDAVLVSVPKGGPVLLRMTDEGINQTLDLRAGTRGADARGRYPSPSQRGGIKEFKAAGVATNPIPTSEPTYGYWPAKTDFTLRTEGAVLVPWAPGAGNRWAERGRAWLRLNGVTVSGGIGSGVGYRLYTHQFFAVSTAGGERYSAVKSSIKVEVIGGVGTYGVYVDVPESFRAGTLHVDPAAGLRQPNGEPVKWITKPKGASFPIRLAG